MNFIVIIVIVLVICHLILINFEINGNHENYASEAFLKQFLVISYLVVGQLKYRSFILISISHSKFSLQSRLLKVIDNQTFKAKKF